MQHVNGFLSEHISSHGFCSDMMELWTNICNISPTENDKHIATWFVEHKVNCWCKTSFIDRTLCLFKDELWAGSLARLLINWVLCCTISMLKQYWLQVAHEPQNAAWCYQRWCDDVSVPCSAGLLSLFLTCSDPCAGWLFQMRGLSQWVRMIWCLIPWRHTATGLKHD